MSVWIAALIIFLVRMFDIACETTRTILVVNGHKTIAASTAFIDVLLWTWMFNEIVIAHRSWICYIAYAGGYALGTYIGGYFGPKLTHHLEKSSEHGKRR